MTPPFFPISFLDTPLVNPFQLDETLGGPKPEALVNSIA